MEQSRGDEESAEIGAACAAGVRGSRFADLGSRPRNVTEHAAAIGDREPQPQPVCGRGMSRGPGPAEAGHSALWRTPLRRRTRCREGSPGLRRRGGRTRAMRHRDAARGGGGEGPAPPGREAILMYPTRFAHHSLDAFGVDPLSRPPSPPRGRHRTRVAPRTRQALRTAPSGAARSLPSVHRRAARDGADRNSRLRCARAEAGESAAALEAAVVLGLASEERGSGPSSSCSIASRHGHQARRARLPLS